MKTNTTSTHIHMCDIITTCLNGIIYIQTLFLANELLSFLHHQYSQIDTLQIVMYTSNAWNQLYEFFDTYTPGIIKTATYQAVYLCNTASARFIGYQIEPYESQWISLSWTSFIVTDTSAQYGTIYQDIYHFRPSLTNIVKNIEGIIHIVNPISLTNEVVIFIVNNGKRIVRILYQPRMFKRTMIEEKKQIFQFFKTIYDNIEMVFFAKHHINPSRVRFLAVSYTHPNMGTHIIDLEVNPDYFIEKNEILSYTFISRLLEYQSDKSYVFDDRYRVKIIDGNIQTVELTSNQYVVLGVRDYQIITL